MSEIKLCPFCGKRGILGQTILNYYVVRCQNEECNMIVQQVIGTTRDEAIKTWNTRQIEDALRSERDEWRRDAERLAEIIGEKPIDEIFSLFHQDIADKAEKALEAHRALVKKEGK